jgi:proteic killer suppression protein
MIQSFSNEETSAIFRREHSTRFPVDIHGRAYRKLVMIHVSVSLSDLRSPPGNHLEKLTGKRDNEYSIRINDQWRICFVWESGHAYRVGIEDYH